MPARRLAARRHPAARSSTAKWREAEGADDAPSARPRFAVRAVLLALALTSAGAGGWGCHRGEAAPDRRPASAAEAIRQVRLGQTTASDLEQRFGAPDERAPDGALVYRFESTREHGGRMRAEAETVTFRFAAGKLAKVCRTRS